jgi:hypothetical protein
MIVKVKRIQNFNSESFQYLVTIFQGIGNPVYNEVVSSIDEVNHVMKFYNLEMPEIQ